MNERRRNPRTRNTATYPCIRVLNCVLLVETLCCLFVVYPGTPRFFEGNLDFMPACFFSKFKFCFWIEKLRNVCPWWYVNNNTLCGKYSFYSKFLQTQLPFPYSQVVFFAGGWVFFMKKLFRDYEVHHHTVQLIFSVTFALSCIMFELIIFEILGVLDAG